MTTFHNIEHCLKKIKKIGLTWKWDDDELRFAGVGSPDSLLANLKSGVFKPIISETALQRKRKIVNVERKFQHEVMEALGEDLDEFVDFDLSDPAINPMLSTSDFHIGEIPVISIRDDMNFENDILRPVEKHLSQVCNILVTAWERLINTVNSTQPVLKAAHELFTLHANEDVLAIDSLTTFNKMSVKLENVFKQLPPRVRLLYEKDKSWLFYLA